MCIGSKSNPSDNERHTIFLSDLHHVESWYCGGKSSSEGYGIELVLFLWCYDGINASYVSTNIWDSKGCRVKKFILCIEGNCWVWVKGGLCRRPLIKYLRYRPKNVTGDSINRNFVNKDPDCAMKKISYWMTLNELEGSNTKQDCTEMRVTAWARVLRTGNNLGCTSGTVTKWTIITTAGTL